MAHPGLNGPWDKWRPVRVKNPNRLCSYAQRAPPPSLFGSGASPPAARLTGAARRRACGRPACAVAASPGGRAACAVRGPQRLRLAYPSECGRGPPAAAPMARSLPPAARARRPSTLTGLAPVGTRAAAPVARGQAPPWHGAARARLPGQRAWAGPGSAGTAARAARGCAPRGGAGEALRHAQAWPPACEGAALPAARVRPPACASMASAACGRGGPATAARARPRQPRRGRSHGPGGGRSPSHSGRRGSPERQPPGPEARRPKPRRWIRVRPGRSFPTGRARGNDGCVGSNQYVRARWPDHGCAGTFTGAHERGLGFAANHWRAALGQSAARVRGPAINSPIRLQMQNVKSYQENPFGVRSSLSMKTMPLNMNKNSRTVSYKKICCML